MSAIEPLCKSIGKNLRNLSKEEVFILEAETFLLLYKDLTDFFRSHHQSYFRTMKFNEKMENEMLEDNFIRCLITDLLSLEEYSLQGIAYHLQMPEEVIYEVAVGQNTNPSFKLSRKIIELHRFVRPQLYQAIVKKVAEESVAYLYGKEVGFSI
jgi:hypothetical protein